MVTNYTSVDPKQFAPTWEPKEGGHPNQHPTPHEGSQNHFRAQEGGYTNQHQGGQVQGCIKNPKSKLFVLHLAAVTSCQDWCLTKWNTSLYKFEPKKSKLFEEKETSSISPSPNLSEPAELMTWRMEGLRCVEI